MSDQRVTIVNHDLGRIKFIPSGSEFPWEIFAGGEINCGFNIKIEDPRHDEAGANINDIRVWVNQNTTGKVFLTYSRWSPTRIAFTHPEDAVKFQLKFGDYLSSLTS